MAPIVEPVVLMMPENGRAARSGSVQLEPGHEPSTATRLLKGGVVRVAAKHGRRVLKA